MTHLFGRPVFMICKAFGLYIVLSENDRPLSRFGGSSTVEPVIQGAH